MKGKGLMVFFVALIWAFALSSPSNAQLNDMELLGKLLYFDKNLSEPDGQACASCHWPGTGFAEKNKGFPVSEGVIHGMFGGRNAPSAAYLAAVPKLHYDSAEGVWIGGAFWDGRATGYELGHPLADQALGPFLADVEMHNGYYDGQEVWVPMPEWVVRDAASSDYAYLFWEAFDGGDPVTYENIAGAIGYYERSKELNKFNSRFDDFWRACKAAGIDDLTTITDPKDRRLPKGILGKQEIEGLILFHLPNDNDGILEKGEGGNCAVCHTMAEAKDPYNDEVTCPPLFTDFTYDNLGIPTNWQVYDLAGGSPPDLGLGGFLCNEDGPGPGLMAAAGLEPGTCISENGKFKVPTLRNVLHSAPYGHNGYFRTLQEIVHFYNTRDVPGEGWPTPEYDEGTVNRDELGKLGLSRQQENAIVSFMKTLTDRGKK